MKICWNKDLQFRQMPFLKIKNVFSYYYFDTSILRSGAMQVVFMSVNLVKLANVFQCNAFVFGNKRRTAYKINIAK